MWRQTALREGAAAELERAISFHCSRQASERGQASESHLAIDETEVDCGVQPAAKLGDPVGKNLSVRSRGSVLGEPLRHIGLR